MIALLFQLAGAATLAVLPFEQTAAPDEFDGFGHALAAMVTTDLSQIDDVTLVERDRLDELLAELDLSTTSFVDRDTALSLGRGLAAEHVVTGSFSVVRDKLRIDAKIVEVETGKIAKARAKSGPVEDFVTVEKDVIDALVENLDLTLVGATRRKIAGSASTENVEAFSAYGAGLEKARSGDEEGARTAFSVALAADPKFAEAQAALARIGSQVTESVEAREAARLDAKLAAQDQVLKASVDERTRGKAFRHDVQSMATWLLRLETLKRTEQHCVRYEEMAAYAKREGIPEGRYDSNALAEQIASQGVELGRLVPDRDDWHESFEPTADGSRPPPLDWGLEQLPYELRGVGNRPTGFLWDIYSWDGAPGDMDRSDGLLASLHHCFEGQDEVDELASLIASVDEDEALAGWHGGDSQQPYTSRMALDTHLASTRAWKLGPGPLDEAHAEALLALAATVPGTEAEFYLQGRASRIQQYGERWVREQEALEAQAAAEAHSKRKRMGYSEEALEGVLQAYVAKDAALLVQTGPLCEAVMTMKANAAQHRLDQLSDAVEDGKPTHYIYDDLWWLIATPKALGCLVGEPAEFDSADAVFAFVDAVEIPEEPSRACRAGVRGFRDHHQNSPHRMSAAEQPAVAASQALMALDEYYRQLFAGCLQAP